VKGRESHFSNKSTHVRNFKDSRHVESCKPAIEAKTSRTEANLTGIEFVKESSLK